MNKQRWERYTGLVVEQSATEVVAKEIREDQENRQHLKGVFRALGLHEKEPNHIPDRVVIGSDVGGTLLVATVGQTSDIWWSPHKPIRRIYDSPVLSVETSVFVDGRYETVVEPLELLTDNTILRFRDLVDLQEFCEKLGDIVATPEPELPACPSSPLSQ